MIQALLNGFSELRELSMLSVIFRVILAITIGGLLGLERGRNHHPAGFRTYMLVCLGAALVMMTNQYAATIYDVDPVRMGAQVVSGIGFLGAGTIIVTGKQQIKGITTAAGLWAAACCGLAVGIGFYEGAILCGVVICFIMAGLLRMDRFIHRIGTEMELYLEFEANVMFSDFLRHARGLGIDVYNVQMHQSNRSMDGAYMVLLNVKIKGEDRKQALEQLSKADGLYHIEELH